MPLQIAYLQEKLAIAEHIITERNALVAEHSARVLTLLDEKEQLEKELKRVTGRRPGPT